ncbi:MAG: hypothetical protein JWL91_1190 [Sphingomonas bacterium]|nr:gene transfer agent family protein [Sphingomonas bacterium]MDB5689314.1 hypothetical protein [Sphingomonas bacterium]
MNPARGETAIDVAGMRVTLRPSFEALVAAEEELGPLFALIERMAGGELRLGEIVGLFWHCAARPPGMARADFAEAVVANGLARATPALRVLIGQVLQGR